MGGLLQCAVLRRRRSSTRTTTSWLADRRAFRGAAGPPVQHLVHAGRHRHVLQLVRRVRGRQGRQSASASDVRRGRSPRAVPRGVERPGVSRSWSRARPASPAVICSRPSRSTSGTSRTLIGWTHARPPAVAVPSVTWRTVDRVDVTAVDAVAVDGRRQPQHLSPRRHRPRRQAWVDVRTGRCTSTSSPPITCSTRCDGVGLELPRARDRLRARLPSVAGGTDRRPARSAPRTRTASASSRRKWLAPRPRRTP